MHNIEDKGVLVHYELTDNSTHVMNARVEAESSLHYVKAVNYISKVLGVSNDLQTGSLSKGSVVKIFWFEFNSDIDTQFLRYIFIRIFCIIFFQNKSVKLENIIDGLDDNNRLAIEKAMQHFQIDEIKINRLNSHLHLKKARTEYFKQLKTCKIIKAVSIKHNEFDNLNSADLRIKSTSFDKFIENFVPEIIIKEDAKVYIVSPVILKDRTMKWSGNYEGKDIKFEMLSNQFKTEAQNGFVEFRTGYFIICRIQYEETFDEDENLIHNNFKVIDVYGHGIDNNYKETKSGIIKKLHDTEPTLFDNLEDWQ